jgi:hypothetical protein
VFFYKIPSVMSKNELLFVNDHKRFGGTCIISILEHFRQDMSWALNLLEKLKPGA